MSRPVSAVFEAEVPGQIDGIIQSNIQESPFYQPAFTTNLDNSEVPDIKRFV